jgi:hypothetical protein
MGSATPSMPRNCLSIMLRYAMEASNRFLVFLVFRPILCVHSLVMHALQRACNVKMAVAAPSCVQGCAETAGGNAFTPGGKEHCMSQIPVAVCPGLRAADILSSWPSGTKAQAYRPLLFHSASRMLPPALAKAPDAGKVGGQGVAALLSLLSLPSLLSLAALHAHQLHITSPSEPS